jgi:hypothetical protein
MLGAIYCFPARAVPLLSQDLEMGLTPAAASWFGKKYPLPYLTLFSKQGMANTS